jgi:hypothetical protein
MGPHRKKFGTAPSAASRGVVGATASWLVPAKGVAGGIPKYPEADAGADCALGIGA